MNKLTKIAVNNYKNALPLEQDIQRDMLTFLEKKGILAIKHNNIGIYARAGVPDILCCAKGGKFIGIEVKRPGQKPKPLQEEFLYTINSLGGIAFSAVSVKEIEKNLKERGIL